MAKNDLSKKRQEYLDKLSPEKRAITTAMWAQKSQEARKRNQELKKEDDFIADRVKNALNSPYIAFDDKGAEHTILDELVASAIANEVKNPKFGFKDLADMQKVVKDENDDNKQSGLVIQVITNGQDLGD